MQRKRILSRANYDSDSEFERDVDELAQRLDTPAKRELMFSLMHQCRGCGNDTTYESTECDVRLAHGVFQRQMLCKACGRAVPIKSTECQSVGRIVTLWNTTPLTIEATHA